MGREPIARLRLAGRALACAVSGALLATSGYIWFEYRDLIDGLTTSQALAVLRDGAPAHLDNSVNLLLIGLDSRKDQDGRDLPKQFVSDELHAGSSDIGGYNTNTLILMHIPANGGRVEAFSIPRDDYVDLVNAPGKRQLGKHKIKEAYDLAKYYATQDLQRQGVTDPVQLEHQGREAGRQATLLTVQKFLNLPIDHFAEVNLLGFYDVAKALGPLTVCLNSDVDDPIVSRTAGTAGHGSGAHFHKGVNQLDAAQALSFVRQRWNLPNGDLDRTHRQQAFLASVTKKLKDQGLFGDIGRLQALTNVVKKDVVIDNSWNVLDFAQQATNLTGGNVEFNTLPIANYATVPSDGDVNLVDVARIRSLVRQQIGLTDPSPSAVPSSSAASGSASASSSVEPLTVEVDASSPRRAEAVAQDLASVGFTGVRTGTASSRSHTTVLYGTGAKDSAEQIADHLGVDSAGPSSSVRAGKVVVTLGADYSGPGSDWSSASPSDTGSGSPSASPSSQYQGPAVVAGGIPCVN